MGGVAFGLCRSSNAERSVVISKMAQIRVRRTASMEIFPHETLEAVLRLADQRFEAITTPEPQQGWLLEALTGLIFMAFLNEATVNAVGAKIDPDWKERRAFGHKIDGLATLVFADRGEIAPVVASVKKL